MKPEVNILTTTEQKLFFLELMLDCRRFKISLYLLLNILIAPSLFSDMHCREGSFRERPVVTKLQIGVKESRRIQSFLNVIAQYSFRAKVFIVKV